MMLGMDDAGALPICGHNRDLEARLGAVRGIGVAQNLTDKAPPVGWGRFNPAPKVVSTAN